MKQKGLNYLSSYKHVSLQYLHYFNNKCQLSVPCRLGHRPCCRKQLGCRSLQSSMTGAGYTRIGTHSYGASGRGNHRIPV